MDLEKKILKILSEELEININQIKLSDPYASLENMDSLTQVSINNLIEEEFEIEFEFDDLFDIETVQDLIDIVNQKLS